MHGSLQRGSSKEIPVPGDGHSPGRGRRRVCAGFTPLLPPDSVTLMTTRAAISHSGASPAQALRSRLLLVGTAILGMNVTTAWAFDARGGQFVAFTSLSGF